MEARLYNDLDRQTLTGTLGGGAFALPTLIRGTDNVLSFRFAARVDGEAAGTPRTVHGVRASVGLPDARPTSGTWRLRLEPAGAESADLAWNATDAEILAACEAVFGAGAVTEVVGVSGSWLALAPAELPAHGITHNKLSPLSFFRSWGNEQSDGAWLYEFRLVQAPYAFTDQVGFRLPQPPVVYEVQAGAEIDDLAIPEIQGIRLDPWFAGVYRLRRGSRVSADLSISDGPDEIAEALQSCLSPTEIAQGADLTVSNPADGVAHVKFGGSLAGVDEALLVVEVVDAPAGDPTIVLDLRGAHLAAALRGGKVVAELEIVWRLADATSLDEEDEEIREVTGYRGTVTILPELAWPGLAVAPEINWTVPPDPRDYKPFSADNIIFGTRNYAVALGAGLEHVVVHGLGTEEIGAVSVRENTAGGALLVHGTDYTVTVDGADQVTVTIDPGYGAVAAEDLAVLITTAGPADHFLAHTHTMAQVTGLEALLAELAGRIGDLEALLPSNVLALIPDPAGIVAEWRLPDIAEVYPLREPVTIPAEGIRAVDLSGVRQSGLLPAVHTLVAPVALTVPLPAAPSEGQSGVIFRNEGAGAVILPGGRGRRSHRVEPDGLVAAWWDEQADMGRWYPVDLEPGTSTYHPSQMERELFELLVTPEQFRAGRRMRVEFGLETAVLRSDTRGAWDLLVEYGTINAAADPGTPGSNVESITWDEAAPAIRQRIYAGPVPQTHRFSLALVHSLADAITAERTIYGAVTSAPAPGTASFALRARLARFDTLDDPDLRGFLAVRGLAATVTEGDEFAGRAWIQ